MLIVIVVVGCRLLLSGCPSYYLAQLQKRSEVNRKSENQASSEALSACMNRKRLDVV